jgi:hypothetical protein
MLLRRRLKLNLWMTDDTFGRLCGAQPHSHWLIAPVYLPADMRGRTRDGPKPDG